ncbi:helix-turn-helix transcriptional regulator [Christiangramia sp.]|uniref:helix-turn-helix domain-containing protein n=1 Tax=Christiangramia sp. TaxID=1931228 RepID=UPI002612C355|nr:helix-turn-helix transcriptional regulator [Christiangramia sp.]
MKISTSPIAKRIRKLRQSKNWTQKNVAEKLFISQAAYSLIEGGQNGISVNHVIRLSKIYHTTTDFILIGKTIPVYIKINLDYHHLIFK